MEERPCPEDLIKEYNLENNPKIGKLKIFFGYAAGVGKTYAMLKAAHRAKNAGADVVVGYIEPHTRPETLRLLDGLEQLDPQTITYKGMQLREFDLDGVLRRKPQLVLVDELAHTNANGCRHRKRYQDVEELLRAGINVCTTVNVQHLESLNDLVSSITGVTVQERVPDRVFDLAAQVEVVDIEPDDLIARLEQGKIYRDEQAQRALSAFFTRKNLAALREIALRRTADRLNRTAQKTPGCANAGEHILICLSASPSNAKVIRTAARMNEALGSRFTALFVETSQFSEMSEESCRRLRQNLKLAEDLGAQIATVYGDDIPVQIAEYSKVSGVTKIVLGRTNHRHDFLSHNSSLIDKLTVLAPKLDVYIIPDNQPEYKPQKKNWRLPESSFWRMSFLDFLKSMLIFAIATLLGFVFFHAGIREENIITVYLLGVLLVAVWTGNRLCGAIISLISVLAFNFFFTDPRFTFQAYAASYPVTFIIMFLSSCLANSLVIRIQQQSRQAARKAYRTEVLLETSQKLQYAEKTEEILTQTAQQISKLLDRPVLFYSVNSEGDLSLPLCFPVSSTEFPPEGITPEEKAVAQWVLKNNKHAGATTNTLPSAQCLYLAVRGKNSVFAVVGIYMGDQGRVLESFDRNLLIAILSECGLALERQSLAEAKKTAELQAQQETLRANLLRAISHDLRTPLTGISGNAGILMENSSVLNDLKKQKLYSDIYDDSMWLINLVENLLSVTRIENGTMSLSLQPELIDDVFHETISHLDRHASEHSIKTILPDDLLMAKMDAHLIVQVMVNLVNNAVKYTDSGSSILLQAWREGAWAYISVTDDGKGIADNQKKRLFDMFYTGANAYGDSRRGLGLGLSLCKSIIEAHGGTISVGNSYPHGTVFKFCLKAAEVNTYE